MGIGTKTFGPGHGSRIPISVIDERARLEPSSPWVSVPKDDYDLSQGFRDITISQFANAVNHAARWLQANLPPSSEPFEPFAYSGPRDLRYPILAVAAGKIGRVVCQKCSVLSL
jgi:hypothetical protein